MADVITSPNMSLPIPIVGEDPNPDWANNVNACLTITDQHNHSSGSGVPINPSGLNINSDLPLNSNNLTTARSVRFQPQGAPLALVSDLGCLYESGVDLYFNDGSGNQIRITQSGGIAGSPGSIANLTSPASASYVSADQTFVWQSAASTPANLDAGFIILRNNVANSNGLTLSPPAAMGSSYSVVLPALPGALSLLTIDASGNMGASALPSNLNFPGKAVKEQGNNLIVSNTNASNSLAVIRGIVNGSGGVQGGEGFTAGRVSTGVYSVNFTAAFMDSPVCVAVVQASNLIVQLASSASSQAVFAIQDAAGNPTDNQFNFIIIGQRA